MELFTILLAPTLLALGVANYAALSVIGLKWLPMPPGVAPVELLLWGCMAVVVLGLLLVGSILRMGKDE